MVIFNSYVKLPEGTQQSTTDLQRYDNVRNFCSFLLDANPQSFIFPSSQQKKTSSHTHTSKKILYKYINIIISDMHSVYIYIYTYLFHHPPSVGFPHPSPFAVASFCSPQSSASVMERITSTASADSSVSRIDCNLRQRRMQRGRGRVAGDKMDMIYIYV